METWRRFINEDNSLNNKSRESMTDPEDKQPEGDPVEDKDLSGEEPQVLSDEDLDDLEEN